MSRSIIPLSDLVIAVGQTVSNVLDSRREFDDAVAITLVHDGNTLNANTYTIEVTAQDPQDAASKWGTLQEAGTDVNAPGLGKARSFDVTAWRGIRIKSSAAMVNVATWKVCKEYFT